MAFALLSDLELRLVDRMFAAGVFREVPAVVRPPGEEPPVEYQLGCLVPLAALIDTAARPVGAVVEHASIDELLRIAEVAGRDPRRDGGTRT
ncbi:MAG: hypothetical protein KF703_07815 [Actinobacteria bacterium]|nr:hypothetical protein [Actinomycetota bacterium]